MVRRCVFGGLRGGLESDVESHRGQVGDVVADLSFGDHAAGVVVGAHLRPEIEVIATAVVCGFEVRVCQHEPHTEQANTRRGAAVRKDLNQAGTQASLNIDV